MEVNGYLILIATTIVGSIAVAILYYFIGYFISERFVDPTFDFNLKRLSEYSLSFFVFSLLMIAVMKVLVSHFHLPDTLLDSPTMIIVPSLIVLILRSIVRFHSSRIGREHLNTIVFILLVSIAAKIIFMAVQKQALTLNLFPWQFIGVILLSSLIVPVSGDFALVQLEKIPLFGSFIRRYIKKEKKLIDITDELPITLEFISGKDSIDKVISEVISRGNSALRIISKTLGTVKNNIVDIKARCRRGGDVRIICAPIETEEIADRKEELQTELNGHNIVLCESTFDNMRVVIDGNNKIIVTFATGGYEGSHIGIYSEHPFIISLFRNYFDTKCNSNDCRLCNETAKCKKK